MFKIKYELNNLINNNTIATIALNTEYKTTLTALSDYTLPETIFIKVDNMALNNTQYTYNTKTGEIIIPGKNVTGNITIEAIATPVEKTTLEIENPVTFDNIEEFILIGILALIGFIATSIYLKKELIKKLL